MPSSPINVSRESKPAQSHRRLRLSFGECPGRVPAANVIAPGLFASKMLEASIERKGVEKLLEPIPLKRLTADADMAGAAIYLASKAGSYVTGAVISVDGGTTL